MRHEDPEQETRTQRLSGVTQASSSGSVSAYLPAPPRRGHFHRKFLAPLTLSYPPGGVHVVGVRGPPWARVGADPPNPIRWPLVATTGALRVVGGCYGVTPGPSMLRGMRRGRNSG